MTGDPTNVRGHNYVSKEILRPEHPDGEKYRFDCCFHDEVYRTQENRPICQNCGHDWTEQLDIKNTDIDQ
jgi:hypothetical protein